MHQLKTNVLYSIPAANPLHVSFRCIGLRTRILAEIGKLNFKVTTFVSLLYRNCINFSCFCFARSRFFFSFFRPKGPFCFSADNHHSSCHHHLHRTPSCLSNCRKQIEFESRNKLKRPIDRTKKLILFRFNCDEPTSGPLLVWTNSLFSLSFSFRLGWFAFQATPVARDAPDWNKFDLFHSEMVQILLSLTRSPPPHSLIIVPRRSGRRVTQFALVDLFPFFVASST